MAGADGSFDDSEREAIADVLTRLGYTPEEVLDAPEPGVPRNTPRLSQLLTSPDDRLQVMRELLRVAHADGVVTGGELGYIERMAEEFEITLEQLVLLNEEVVNEL